MVNRAVALIIRKTCQLSWFNWLDFGTEILLLAAPREGMERASEDFLCEACRVRATQKVELVGRASGSSLSLPWLPQDWAESEPAEDTASVAWQRVGENGPVFVKKNPLNMFVHNNVSFHCGVKHEGLSFNTIWHAQLEFSFHDIFNNTFR